MAIISKKFDTTTYKAVYKVEESEDNMRLDQYLQIFLESFSREAVKKKIYNGEIRILGRPGTHRPSTRLKQGDIVELLTHKTKHEDEWWRGEKLELELIPEIAYEDDDLIVISKPPYMSTHPTGKHLFNCATVFFEARDNKTIHSIHRLDRETSGLLLLGKNPEQTKILTQAFENNLVSKTYFYIAKIDPSRFDGVLEFDAHERLGASEGGLKRVYINYFPVESTEGKRAETHFKILHIENGYCLGLAFPVTGRQHQIRVHAFAHGFPLVGDKLYLGNFPMFQRFKDNIASEDDYDLMELPRHALHATAIKIPYKGKDTIFRTNLPTDFKNWIKNKMTIPLEELQKLVNQGIDEHYNLG